jgi:hypothetical protein
MIMQNKHLIIILTFFICQNLIAQKNYTISGYIEDELSGERLIGQLSTTQLPL